MASDWWGNDRVNDHYIHNGKWEKKPRPGYEGAVIVLQEKESWLSLVLTYRGTALPRIKWRLVAVFMVGTGYFFNYNGHWVLLSQTFDACDADVWQTFLNVFEWLSDPVAVFRDNDGM